VLRIARRFEKAVEVLGSEQSAQQWFQSPVKGLGGDPRHQDIGKIEMAEP
jgi:uncharacterized protein (DUF2384 family)